MTINMREIRRSDIEVLLALRLRWLSELHGATGTTELERAWFSRYPDNPMAFALVAETGQKCVGYALFDLLTHPTQRGVSAMIEEVFVSEPYRRQGVGRRLVDTVRERVLATAENVTTIRARVDRNDETAIAFWSAIGFEHHVIEFTDYLD